MVLLRSHSMSHDRIETKLICNNWKKHTPPWSRELLQLRKSKQASELASWLSKKAKEENQNVLIAQATITTNVKKMETIGRVHKSLDENTNNREKQVVATISRWVKRWEGVKKTEPLQFQCKHGPRRVSSWQREKHCLKLFQSSEHCTKHR